MNAKYAPPYNFSRISRTKNEYRNWDQQHQIKVERKHHRFEMHHLAMFKLHSVQNTYISQTAPMQHERDWKLREFFSYNEHQNHSTYPCALPLVFFFQLQFIYFWRSIHSIELLVDRQSQIHTTTPHREWRENSFRRKRRKNGG